MPWYAELLSKSVLGALACFAFAAGDAFWAHRFSTDQELVLFLAGMGALGLGGALSAGIRIPTPAARPGP
jgi:hypothetical protein